MLNDILEGFLKGLLLGVLALGLLACASIAYKVNTPIGYIFMFSLLPGLPAAIKLIINLK